MNGNLIDTNVIIKLFNNDKTAVKLFNEAIDIAIPVTVVGELFYGAYKSSKTEKNLKVLLDFLSEYPVLYVDGNTAAIYGEIKNELAKKGSPIPENDIWIAAIAKSSARELITFDGHFSKINGLRIKDM